jgi:hypothetical protein
MRRLSLAFIAASSLSLLLATAVAAKGPIGATIDPGDPQAGEPTDMSVTLTMEDGQPMEDIDGMFIEFTHLGGREQVRAPIDHNANGVYSARLILPYDGRWSARVGVGGGVGEDFFFPTIDGDAPMIAVAPAGTAAAAAPPVTSAAWPSTALALAVGMVAGVVLTAAAFLGIPRLRTRRFRRRATAPASAR